MSVGVWEGCSLAQLIYKALTRLLKAGRVMHADQDHRHSACCCCLAQPLTEFQSEAVEGVRVKVRFFLEEGLRVRDAGSDLGQCGDLAGKGCQPVLSPLAVENLQVRVGAWPTQDAAVRRHWIRRDVTGDHCDACVDRVL